jgi:uncharacterized protein YkwD
VRDVYWWDDPRRRLVVDPVAHARCVVSRRALLVGITGLTVAATLREAARAEAGPPDVPALLTLLIEHVNQERATTGLGPLRPLAELNAAAQTHANDMAAHDFVAHDSSDGTGQFERIMRFYPHDTWLGENIGAGYPSVEALMTAWRASPPHHQNLLGPDFRAVGVGLAFNPAARYRWYWTIDLGGHLDEPTASGGGEGGEGGGDGG